MVVVDDDETFRTGLAENLRQDAHRVVDRASPATVDGEDLAGAHVLITDYQMEPTDGVRFADAVHAAHPSLPVLLVSAYATRDLEAEVSRRAWMRLCRKPLDYDALHEEVHAAAARR